MPRRPSRELDAAVERREDRLGGPAEAEEAGWIEPSRRVRDRTRVVVRCCAEPDRRDLAAEERRLLAVAERHAEVDELHEPTGPSRQPADLGSDLDVCGSEQRRRGRAGLEARELEPRLRAAREPVERDNRLDPVAEGRRRREPLGTEAAVGATVRGEEDERVLGLRPARNRPEPSVAAGELDQCGRARGVVVRARPDAGVVTVGENEDGVIGRALHDGDEVLEPDAAEAGDALVPDVRQPP